jgi:7-cyano-7-deazaguanine synthase
MSLTLVLLSGGLDSAVLLADEAVRRETQPVYVRTGLAWEEAEQATMMRLLGSGGLRGHVRPFVSLSVDMTDAYGAMHWSIQGHPPGYHTPDEDVYLPGRNVILLSKAAVYGAAVDADRIVLGTLGHNPFPDATPQFRGALGRALALGLAHPMTIDAPFADLSKAEVVRRGIALGVPFNLTLSCMNPIVRGAGEAASLPRHCGACSKCRERHDAFLEAGVSDPTEYVEKENVRRRGDQCKLDIEIAD